MGHFIFLAIACECGWPVLFLAASSSHRQTMVSVLMIAEIEWECRWSRIHLYIENNVCPGHYLTSDLSVQRANHCTTKHTLAAKYIAKYVAKFLTICATKIFIACFAPGSLSSYGLHSLHSLSTENYIVQTPWVATDHILYRLTSYRYLFQTLWLTIDYIVLIIPDSLIDCRLRTLSCLNSYRLQTTYSRLLVYRLHFPDSQSRYTILLYI